MAAIAQNATAQGVIDVHSHIISPTYTNYLNKNGAALDEGFPLPHWDVESQLKWMDEAGVKTSVLTLAAPHPQYGGDKEAIAVIRKLNEEAAAIKKRYPGRFLFCATLPLPNVQAAINEAKYALDTLHADGIKLATNVNGQYLGAPELDPLFEMLNERGAVIILHPHKPDPVNATVMKQTPLAMQEYLSETTRTLGNMITRNVPARFNKLKIVVPHCGAYLPLSIPRMKALEPVMRQFNMVGAIQWEENLKNLYFDLAGAHSPSAIRALLSITLPSHLLYGSDFPYVAPSVLTASLRRMEGYLQTEADLAPYHNMILRDNARQLFGLVQANPDKDKAPVGETCATRIADIEIYPQYINKFIEAAKTIAATSLKEEPGVLCLSPYQLKESGTLFRVMEIYSSKDAYQHHIQTEHFKHYKQITEKMVKTLRLNDLTPLGTLP